MRKDVGTRSEGLARLATRVLPIVLVIAFVGCVENPQGPQQGFPIGGGVQSAPPPPPPAPPVPTPPSPSTFNVRVAAVTTGAALDPDGYRVQIEYNPDEMLPFYASDTVATNGSTVFELGGGYYYAYLLDIAPNCTAVPPGFAPILLGGFSNTALVTLPVECFAIPLTQGVRVSTVTTGTFPDTAIFRLRISAEGDDSLQAIINARMMGANDMVTIPSPAGSFRLYLDTRALWKRCNVRQSSGLPARVEPNRMVPLTFDVACTP